MLENPENPEIAAARLMSREEIVDALLSAMRLNASRVKLGRVTFDQAVHGIGMSMFANKIAEQLGHSILFLKKPPTQPAQSTYKAPE
jgi:hypothetical protein